MSEWKNLLLPQLDPSWTSPGDSSVLNHLNRMLKEAELYICFSTSKPSSSSTKLSSAERRPYLRLLLEEMKS